MHGSFAMLPQARRWAIVYIALYFSAIPGRAAPFLSGVPADVTVECGAVPAPPEVTAYGYLPGQSFGGLVLYYSFDRPDGGQVMDDSGHSRTGHVNGATWIPEGRCGGAYQFDTINQNITASDAGLPSGDAPRSVAAWIKLNQAYPNNSTEYFSYGTRSYNQLTSLGLDWRLDRDRFNFSQYGGVFLTQQRMEQTGVWYHVVYTYGGAGAHAFYINGVRTDGLNELRGAIQTQLSGLLMLGGHPQNAGSLGPDGGFLDEVMVFDRVLTGLEAQRLAQRSGGSLPVIYSEREEGICPQVIQRVWSATDAIGNTVSATQTITVVDTTPPVLAGVPEDMTIECGEAEPVPPVVTAYDTCGGSSAVAAPTNGLVLYYSFDSDPGSVIADESGTGNQGVRQGCTWVVDGYRGGALRFDGVSDHLRVANTPSINSAAFTVSAWVKSEQAQAEVDAGIFGKHRQHDNVNSWWVHQAQDAIRTPTWGQYYGSFVNTRVPLGGAIQEWFMVSATYDGQKIRLYIDGVLREEQAITGYTGNGYDLLIGSGEFAWEGGGAQRLWQGLIDEPRMYNRALSEAEVEQLYRAGTASSGLAVQYEERRSGDACSLRIERVWSATDACGNTASATQTITVVDTMSPVLVMPSSMELEATASCGAVLACCTRGLGYWKNHPDLWPLDTVLVMGQPWSKMDALRVLWTPPSGDPTYLLVHQLIPALLNTANSCSGETWRVMADLLSDAQTWLTEHPLGSNELSAVEREMTLQLAAQLEDFNEGVTGPGVCREKKLRGGSPMPGCATLPDLTSKAVASDGCSDVTLTQAPAPGVEIPVGSSLEVSIQAEDACGNRTSGVMVVSVPLRPPMLAQDPDTDGMTTGDELIAGSDAASAASVFAVSEMVVQDDGVCCVRWDSAPNRSYIIETSAYLDGPYTSVATKRPTSPGKTEYRHLTTEDGPRFYRVRALIE